MKDVLGVNYYFGPQDYADAVFAPERCDALGSGFVQTFKAWIEARYDVAVHTWDCIEASAPEVKAVLYFDYSWRYAKRDPFLEKIPFEKRALMMIEPANVNPSLYYLRRYRDRFSTVFTWDRRLLARHPQYKPVNVPVGAEPSVYRENRFKDIPFSEKKLLIAVSRNRWSYMPQSTYCKRKAAYSYFDAQRPEDFDLFGPGWNAPSGPFDKWLGYPRYRTYRGVLPGDWDGKVARMANYRFAICFENNANQPGYISEKITDCFCARCVPVYYGSEGTEDLIPRTCWIDARAFRSYRDLEAFVVGMTAEQHAEYVRAIDAFMKSPALDFFSTEHYFRTLAEGLGLEQKKNTSSTI